MENRLREIKEKEWQGQSDVVWLIETIEQLQTTHDLLLEQIKQNTLQIKEMKQNSRLTRFWVLAEENLKLAQEVARLKGEVLSEPQMSEM